jgi:hypothetical protein
VSLGSLESIEAYASECINVHHKLSRTVLDFLLEAGRKEEPFHCSARGGGRRMSSRLARTSLNLLILASPSLNLLRHVAGLHVEIVLDDL